MSITFDTSKGHLDATFSDAVGSVTYRMSLGSSHELRRNLDESFKAYGYIDHGLARNAAMRAGGVQLG